MTTIFEAGYHYDHHFKIFGLFTNREAATECMEDHKEYFENDEQSTLYVAERMVYDTYEGE